MTSEEIEATIKLIQEYGEHGCENVSQVVMAFMSGEQHREFQDKLISLLRQADPKTHMELPVDADGVPIHVGDELCGHYYPDGGVYCVSINGSEAIFVSKIGEHYKDAMLWKPSDCRHYHKPTVEELLFEFGKICQDGYDIGNSIYEYAEKLREVMWDERKD